MFLLNNVNVEYLNTRLWISCSVNRKISVMPFVPMGVLIGTPVWYELIPLLFVAQAQSTRTEQNSVSQMFANATLKFSMSFQKGVFNRT